MDDATAGWIESRNKSIKTGRPPGQAYGSPSAVEASLPQDEQTIVSGTI
ncbi:unnamed protein product [marine sediment metagenome]|uniref:Uncharacterized protein n=1 Tax=marine sediment metagenome TaxID=412755 RepID=X0X9K8_9ZZZZ